MTILDRKKIRPDILKIQDDSFKEQMKFVLQFKQGHISAPESEN